MKYIETDFSKELGDLLTKHKKIITADKHGLYAIDCNYETFTFIGKAETACEDFRDKLMFINK
jgi:hypothetical protein